MPLLSLSLITTWPCPCCENERASAATRKVSGFTSWGLLSASPLASIRVIRSAHRVAQSISHMVEVTYYTYTNPNSGMFVCVLFGN